MTRTMRDALRMPVVARANAEQLGVISGVVVNAGEHRFEALHIGGPKRNPRFIDWSEIASFGEDAVIVDDPEVVREAANELEERTAKNRAPLLDQRVLSVVGDEIGTVSDLTFESESGVIVTIEVGERRLDGDQLRGAGTYAVVVDADAD